VVAEQLARGGGESFVAGLRPGGRRSAIVVVRAGRVVRTLPITGDPAAAGFGLGSAWVVTGSWQVRGRFGPALLWRVRPSGRGVRRIVLPGLAAGGVAVGEGDVWITNGDYRGRLFRIDGASGRRLTTIPLDGLASGVATTAGAVWVTLSDRGLLERVDPSSGRVVARVRVGRSPFAVAAEASHVWVANESDGTVSEVDAGSNRVVATIRVGPRAFAIAASRARVSVVSDYRRHVIVSFDPSAPGRQTRVRVAVAPQGLVVSGRALTVIGARVVLSWP
jgi:YVTN family beta-propeller protein